MVGSSTMVPVSHPSPSFSPHFYFFLLFPLFYLQTLFYFVLPIPLPPKLSPIPLPTILPLLVVIDLQCSFGLVCVLAEN